MMFTKGSCVRYFLISPFSPDHPDIYLYFMEHNGETKKTVPYISTLQQGDPKPSSENLPIQNVAQVFKASACIHILQVDVGNKAPCMVHSGGEVSAAVCALMNYVGF